MNGCPQWWQQMAAVHYRGNACVISVTLQVVEERAGGIKITQGKHFLRLGLGKAPERGNTAGMGDRKWGDH